MDAAGLAVSIPALVKVIRALTDQCRAFHDAPKELAQIQQHLLIVNAEIQLLDNLQSTHSSADDDQLPPQLSAACKRAYSSAKATISSIEDAAQPQRLRGLRARFHWSLIGQTKTKHLLDSLRGTETSIIMVSLLLSRYQPRYHDTLSDLIAGMLDIQRQLSTLKQPGSNTTNTNSSADVSPENPERALMPQDRVAGASIVMLSEPQQYGIPNGRKLRVSISSYGNQEQKTRLISLRTLLPFAWLIGQRAFMISFALRSYSACSLGYSILSGSWLGVANIIPDDAKIMEVCLRGDLASARDLIQTGRARPSDTTLDFNYTPLTNAVVSGNVELVDFLIRNGANINTLFGRLQTSYLAWALRYRHEEVVRLLLDKGADLHHVGALGWSPMFYLWTENKQQEQSSVPLLRMMSAKNDFYPFDHNLKDIKGWDVLHRAAAFGTAEDVKTLIDLGARPDSIVGPLRWRAIHRAAFYDNLPTLIELLPHHEDLGINYGDERGWTLLHIAASAGNDQIVRHLLKLGADPFRKSIAFWSHMPDHLYGQGWMPAEVARAQSEERYHQFMQALVDFGHAPPEVLADNDMDAYCDALEYQAVQSVI